MKDLLIIRIVFIFLFLILTVLPATLHAVEIDLSMNEIELGESVQAPNQMSQKEMNDLFGEDPYLGQTSYLQSPDGFNQKEKSK